MKPVIPPQAPIKHDTAGAIILTNTKPAKTLLVHHRRLGLWVQPGGHQETWENSLETTIREVQEETGLDIAPHLPSLTPIDDVAAHVPVPKYILEELIPAYGTEPEHYHLDHIYVARIPEQTVTHNQTEHHDIGWFTLGQIQDLPMFPNTRELLTQELTS